MCIFSLLFYNSVFGKKGVWCIHNGSKLGILHIESFLHCYLPSKQWMMKELKY